MTASPATLDEYRAYLLRGLPKKSRVYVVTVHRTKGGASHHKVLIAATSSQANNFEPEILDVTHRVAALCKLRVNDKSLAIVMSGFGYNRSFAIVNSLAFKLYPDGTGYELNLVQL